MQYIILGVSSSHLETHAFVSFLHYTKISFRQLTDINLKCDTIKKIYNFAVRWVYLHMTQNASTLTTIEFKKFSMKKTNRTMIYTTHMRDKEPQHKNNSYKSKCKRQKSFRKTVPGYEQSSRKRN